jgi:hypothetical protein
LRFNHIPNSTSHCGLCYTARIKLDSEKDDKGKRWSLETTGAVDRAIAMLIGLVAVAGAHILGLDADVAKLLASGL